MIYQLLDYSTIMQDLYVSDVNSIIARTLDELSMK